MIKHQLKKAGFLLCIIALSNPALAWRGGEERTSEREDAMALKPNVDNGKKIFELCTHCHTEDGNGYQEGISRRQVNGFYPILAGQHKNVIIKQLADIRNGNRDNPQMYPFTLDKYIGGPQDIADVTAFIETLPIHLVNNIGPGRDLELGKKLYNDHCADCHGKNGEGSNADLFPRVQGQHYAYMLRQFRWIKDGRRRNANEKMREQIASFTYKEMQAVVDYTSRLKAKKGAK